MNEQTMGNKIGVSIAQGSDVPNFVKDVPNFVNGVPRVPKSVPKWGTTSNHFSRVSKGRNGPWKER